MAVPDTYGSPNPREVGVYSSLSRGRHGWTACGVKKYTKLVCTSQTPKLGSGARQLNEVNKNEEVWSPHTEKELLQKKFKKAMFRPSGLHQGQSTCSMKSTLNRYR